MICKNIKRKKDTIRFVQYLSKKLQNNKNYCHMFFTTKGRRIKKKEKLLASSSISTEETVKQIAT